MLYSFKHQSIYPFRISRLMHIKKLRSITGLISINRHLCKLEWLFRHAKHRTEQWCGRTLGMAIDPRFCNDLDGLRLEDWMEINKRRDWFQCLAICPTDFLCMVSVAFWLIRITPRSCTLEQVNPTATEVRYTDSSPVRQRGSVGIEFSSHQMRSHLDTKPQLAIQPGKRCMGHGV